VHRDALKRLWLFSELADSELEQVRALARQQRYPARTVIVAQGDESSDLFLVVDGRLRVSSSNANGDEVVLSIMGPGDVFGEMALLDGEPRSATVTTLEACQLLVIEARAFHALLRRMPALSASLMKVMARRIRDLTDRTQDVALLDVESHLAKIVLALAGRFGDHSRIGETAITLRLSQQELASMVGATRELVNRRLRAWAQRGIIEQVSGALVIKQEGALKAMIGEGGEQDEGDA
jgi:CRP/FNR family cyclic AMP-dependent transcriptional regulator